MSRLVSNRPIKVRERLAVTVTKMRLLRGIENRSSRCIVLLATPTRLTPPKVAQARRVPPAGQSFWCARLSVPAQWTAFTFGE